MSNKEKATIKTLNVNNHDLITYIIKYNFTVTFSYNSENNYVQKNDTPAKFIRMKDNSSDIVIVVFNNNLDNPLEFNATRISEIEFVNVKTDDDNYLLMLEEIAQRNSTNNYAAASKQYANFLVKNGYFQGDLTLMHDEWLKRSTPSLQKYFDMKNNSRANKTYDIYANISDTVHDLPYYNLTSFSSAAEMIDSNNEDINNFIANTITNSHYNNVKTLIVVTNKQLMTFEKYALDNFKKSDILIDLAKKNQNIKNLVDDYHYSNVEQLFKDILHENGYESNELNFKANNENINMLDDILKNYDDYSFFKKMSLSSKYKKHSKRSLKEEIESLYKREQVIATYELYNKIKMFSSSEKIAKIRSEESVANLISINNFNCLINSEDFNIKDYLVTIADTAESEDIFFHYYDNIIVCNDNTPDQLTDFLQVFCDNIVYYNKLEFDNQKQINENFFKNYNELNFLKYFVKKYSITKLNFEYIRDYIKSAHNRYYNLYRPQAIESTQPTQPKPTSIDLHDDTMINNLKKELDVLINSKQPFNGN